MADSIDRVFAHALQTVRKIPRSGSARPPASDRLKLYGLYKQSMEGDVAGVMERPSLATATNEADLTREERAEVEKWDAWSSCEGLTRSEAKCKYIDALIQTMHTYAYGTPEARELVNELEFVWDQVRSNAAQTLETERGEGEEPRTKEGLRVLRPMSDQDENEEARPTDENEPPRRRRNAASSSWQARVDGALVQMTAEIAALREVVEARSRKMWGTKVSRQGWMRWVVGRVWSLCTRVVVDVCVVACVLVVLKWRSGGVSEVVEFWREWRERIRRMMLRSGVTRGTLVGRRKEGG